MGFIFNNNLTPKKKLTFEKSLVMKPRSRTDKETNKDKEETGKVVEKETTNRNLIINILRKIQMILHHKRKPG